MNFDLLLEILWAYVTDGLLFACGHFFLLAFIFYDIFFGPLRREIRALQSWEPEEAGVVSPELAESATILDHFVRECQVLSPQGFFVPLTDFSDRLDSIVESLLTNLYNRINMLLIVGIAGTLFGIFEFAVRGSHELQDLSNESLSALGTVLSESMAKAFPVGFAGLVLMMVCHFLVPYPERQLRRAVARAIGLAVSKRQELSRSQARVVEEAAASIERAMQPLDNLEKTLADTITPVVERFGEEMAKSHEFFKNQFDELTGATSKIESAVKGVQRNVEVLQHASERLDETLKSAPEALQATIRLQQEQARAFELFRDTNAEAQETLKLSIATFGTQLESLVEGYQKALGGVQASMSASVDRSLSEISQKATLLCDVLSTRVSLFVKSAEDEIRASAGHIQDVVRAASGALRQLEDLPNGLKEDISGAFEGIQDHVLVVARTSITDINQTVDSHVANLRKLLDARLEEDRRVIGKLDEKIPQLTGAMESFVRTSEEAVAKMAAEVGEKWRSVSEDFRANIEASTESLAKLQELPSAAEMKLGSTLSRLREETREILSETWEHFISALQATVLPRLVGLDQDAESVRKHLENAALAWQSASQNAVTAIRDPIEETVANAEAEIKEILAKLDQALARRYPEVIRDAERFTASLSEMTDRIEEVGRSFEATMEEVRGVQREIKKIPELAADSLFDTVAKAVEKGQELRIEKRLIPRGDATKTTENWQARVKRTFQALFRRGGRS